MRVAALLLALALGAGCVTGPRVIDSDGAPYAGFDSDGKVVIYKVTRDYESDPTALPHWRVWERDGISWRLAATLPPDDVSLGE